MSRKETGRRIGLRANPPSGRLPRIITSERWQWTGLAAASVWASYFVPALVRHPLRTLHRSLVVGAATAASLWLRSRFELSHPACTRLTLPIHDLPARFHGLRIGVLSDLHLDKRFAPLAVERAIRQLRRERPDLVLILGDFVSKRVDDLLLRRLLGQLDAPLGVIAIWGNHDHWDNIPELRPILAELGITLLENSHTVVQRGNDRLYVAGTDDQWDSIADLDAALAGIPAGSTTILLAHEPDIVDDSVRRGVALQLSGHVHGGHIALPVLGPLFKPRYGWCYPRGLYQVGRAWLYVGRGLGGLPLRLGSRTEWTLIELAKSEN